MIVVPIVVPIFVLIVVDEDRDEDPEKDGFAEPLLPGDFSEGASEAPGMQPAPTRSCPGRQPRLCPKRASASRIL